MPKLLDLFCGAGGAAMGYHRAGFEVVGVDRKAQKNYPFEFHQADAMTYPLDGFDVIHASPLWFRFTTCAAALGTAENHPDDVTPIYDRLRACGKPWVVESGSTGPLKDCALFCGPAFGLKVIRHMYFASSHLILTPGCNHVRDGCAQGIYAAYRGQYHTNRRQSPIRSRGAWRAAARLDWMTQVEAELAVPPAYTEYIGRHLLTVLEAAA